MTKVQKYFQLQAELDETLMERIADANAIYGIERIVLMPGGKEIMVEFDASRLLITNVEAALGQAGVPAVEVANA